MSDLKLVDGDLFIDNNQNDLAIYLLKEDAVYANLHRRILTVKEQYLTYFYNSNIKASTILDTDYGTNLTTLPASPNPIVRDRITNEVMTSISAENRVTLSKVEIFNTNEYSIKINISYYYNDNEYSIEV